MQRRTIMIVDETPDHRRILRLLLAAVGYRVLESSGDDALDRVSAEQPDLILMAISLPGHPGWETARRLCAQPALAETPILGTTVYNTLLTAPRVRAIGCVDFVDKPFDLDDLLYRISRLLPEVPRPAFAA
ncbi:MAG TPA: response regulator [Roseiflexaceae bacterium]|nr:response regulator [Roseiflexaceae bacterium]